MPLAGRTGARNDRLRRFLFVLTAGLCVVVFYSVSLASAHYTP